MRLGFYYSQAQDWHEPGGAGNTWDFGPDQGAGRQGAEGRTTATCAARRSRRCKELLTGYGPVALIWFDTPRMMTPERGQRFADLVRSLQPNDAHRRPARHRRRLPLDRRQRDPARSLDRGVGDAGDDQRHLGLPHATTRTGSLPAKIAFKLVDIVSKGGNYLLNVGPTAEGVIPQAERRTFCGRWAAG